MNGKELAKEIRGNLKIEVEELKKQGIIPKLAVIMIGDDKASQVYVRNKSKACDEIGIEYEEYLKDASTTQEELLNLIDELNEREDISGILLQSPIPKHLDIREAFNRIDYKKDVDGFNPVNVGKLAIGIEPYFYPATPQGILMLLDEYRIPIEGANAVVIGRSNIVGRPMAQMLLNRNATVTVCHSYTKDIESKIKTADILISAVGKKIVRCKMDNKNSVIVDVGIFRDTNGKLTGDVDFDFVSPSVKYISPVPGGVGPMTIASLMYNASKVYR